MTQPPAGHDQEPQYERPQYLPPQGYIVRPQRPSLAHPVTYVLIALNVLSFLAELFVPGYASSIVLTYTSAMYEPWRLLTSAFMHFSIFHIGLNMLALYMLGRPLEMILGAWKFIVLYFVSALGGSAVYLLFAQPELNPLNETQAGGASGAIFGLFGALVVMERYKLVRSGSLLPILAINLAISFLVPGIGWQAHIGGLILGAGTTWAFMRGMRKQTSIRTMWVEVVLIAALVVAAIVARYTIL
ncbi:rhomboid family intramembrane serine protease [Propionibacteriaceae bacterium G57]|uniref:rhomboid family intramembrane serine protease n=1 Tax=Aestuariimicrobium sp. G57 TaxID=3418485 RepID=UPI003DA72A37